MEQRMKNASEDPRKRVFLQLLSVLIVAGVMYKLTNNLVIGIIFGLFSVLPSGKKKKWTFLENRLALKGTSIKEETAVKTADVLGEETERERQRISVIILITTILFCVGIYFFLQNGDMMKEIEGMLRNT